MAEFDYQRYLASREWKIKRQQVRQRSGGICERCHLNPATQCHHDTYERLGHERLEDLRDLCTACHRFVENLSTYDPLNPPVFADEFLESERIAHDDQPSIAGQLLAEGIDAVTAESLSAWNAKVQQSIEGMKDNPHLAMRIAQIKLKVNQKFHQNRRAS